MTFFWPEMLWLLIPAVFLAVMDSMRRSNGEASRHRPKILRAWAGVRQAAVGNGRHISRGRLLLWIGLAFGIVALARPQWGRIEEPALDQSREIVIALDLSRSMLAPDVPPSRLERARLLIQGLLDDLHGERVGLVVFAGTAFLQVPLSADYEVLDEFLPSLSPSFMPVGGTDYEAMLHAALDAFDSSGGADRYLIILSDGESQTDDWQSLVGDLKKKNIHVIALGVGTAQGAFIPDETGGYVKDSRGAVVLSKLNSSTLQELATATNGVYTDASRWVDLGAVLKQTVAAGRRGEFKEQDQVRQVERFQWALAPALLCLLLSLWREFPIRPRARILPLASDAGPRRPETGAPAPNTAGSAQPGRDKKTMTAPVAASALGLLLLSGLLYPRTGFAAEDTSVYAAPLSRLVAQLSAQPAQSAADFASFANETITWGRRLQEAKQSVTPGPVRDALTGVDAGEKLSSSAADWPKLRRELEAFLVKPPEPPKQKQQQKKDQKQQQNNGGGKSPQSEPKKSPQSNSPSNSKSSPPPPDQANTGETQRIGGQRLQSATKSDPALVLPIQKLDQLRNQDSPAELFQMLDNRDAKPLPKEGNDW